jgi:uncharacterized SAM-binding protein YcdF (DUF218 family)
LKHINKYLIVGSSLLLIFLVAYFSVAFYVGKQAERDTKTKSDAILVLGARSYIEGSHNPCLKARVLHAVELYRDGYAQKIIFSGGDDKEDTVNEAETMQKIAISNGVLSNRIIMEKTATSTYENFSLSQKLLAENNVKSVIIVTEPFHMARASLVAKKLGYNYSVSPAEKSPCWQPNKYFTKYFLKEPFAITAYKLQNKL